MRIGVEALVQGDVVTVSVLDAGLVGAVAAELLAVGGKSVETVTGNIWPSVILPGVAAFKVSREVAEAAGYVEATTAEQIAQALAEPEPQIAEAEVAQKSEPRKRAPRKAADPVELATQ